MAYNLCSLFPGGEGGRGRIERKKQTFMHFPQLNDSDMQLQSTSSSVYHFN